MLTGKYKLLHEILTRNIDRERIFSDPLHTLAFGTDASFYRLIPKLVIRAKDEAEISLILKSCSELALPVTFRAAGTSLSGQAITDSVLILAGSHWKKFHLNNDGSKISLQPGLTGGRVNSILAPFGRKIGPDPASINSAMIGGIAANNASGMCCGTAENSYKTVAGMRIILADGSILDTREESDRKAFAKTHRKFLSDIANLALTCSNNVELTSRIRKKFKMKNTTGYSLNALIDFNDPIDIIEHLMIGSEGTLGFISEISFRTVKEYSHKASSLIIFPDIEKACIAVPLLKTTPVTAVELIDRAGLHSVEDEKGMPGFLKTFENNACALLVETAASDENELIKNIGLISNSIKNVPVVMPVLFTSVRSEYEQLWKIRKGLFPSVGAMRKSGTTVIIEDVAFPVESLAEATLDLQYLLRRYEYNEAVIFGHALEGNLHFVFTQDFSKTEEINRYAALMDDVSDLVVKKYDGSLKAEHGTGRNMAPFVEMEWGQDAYRLMKEIKRIFDPLNILNPGVILNNDEKIHLKNLKPLPEANKIIDKCTECGFCEPSCVSSDLTLTPRQRIVIHREIVSLRKSGKNPHIAASLANSFSYAGDSTCATDGLCALSCPVKIDTGKLIKELRSESTRGESIANWTADHMRLVSSLSRTILSGVNIFHNILGTKTMTAISGGLRFLSGKRIPAWNQFMPSGAKPIKLMQHFQSDKKVVYVPSCINQSMGLSADQKTEVQLSEKIVSLLNKAGYEVVYPPKLNDLCCGMAFSSKGFIKAGKKKSDELENALIKASNNGEYPVLCDMSPCLYTMRENMKSGLRLYEPVQFIMEFLLPCLTIKPLNETITVFPVCSMKKMEMGDKLVDLARICARDVIITDSNCCGFAGDKGFNFPELNRHGLRSIKNQIPAEVKEGFSTSRTCEIGLSLHSGVSYKSIVYLVDRVSVKK